MDLSTPILQSLSEGVVIAHHGRIVDVNPAFCAVTGFAREEVVGEQLPRPLLPPSKSVLTNAVWRHLLADEAGDGELRLVRKNGERFDASLSARPVHGPDGAVIGCVTTIRDVTDTKRQEAHLRRLAGTDALTGLLNRRRFNELLRREVGRARRHDRPLSLALLDMDRFKNVNDTHGHLVGDRVLAETANRLRRIVRASEHVGRVGGEEFGWILPDTGVDGALHAVERARTSIKRRAFRVAGTLTVSAGVCELTAEDDATLLYERADDALYRAKTGGRDRICR
jgi:diguanylate cyclase (GGDEF)-like protein/PAS domain S-box-containing protein